MPPSCCRGCGGPATGSLRALGSTSETALGSEAETSLVTDPATPSVAHGSRPPVAATSGCRGRVGHAPRLALGRAAAGPRGPSESGLLSGAEKCSSGRREAHRFVSETTTRRRPLTVTARVPLPRHRARQSVPGAPWWRPEAGCRFRVCDARWRSVPGTGTWVHQGCRAVRLGVESRWRFVSPLAAFTRRLPCAALRAVLW